VAAGVGNGLADDLLVPKVYAVEHADGEADLAAAVTQFVCGVDDFHWHQTIAFRLLNRSGGNRFDCFGWY